MVYAPIIPIKKYEEILIEEGKNEQEIGEHFKSIRDQQKNQVFYLPEYKDVMEESVVFLDRVLNLPNNFINRQNLKKSRLFTLSNFGNYLFVFKLSIHFTRIQDGVDRGDN